MADYKQSEVSGSQWQRCWGVYIQNLMNSTPVITLREEQVTVVGDQTFTKDMGQMTMNFDPTASIELLDTTTGDPTGSSISMLDMYQALWSLYMAKAVERDAQVAP